MNIKLIACGSTKWDRFVKNWGLAFLIDDDVLFDTFGKPRVFLKNIKKLNVDISRIKHIIISHDHWDHMSGLWDILAFNKNVTVYVCLDTDNAIKEKIKSYGVILQEIDTARCIIRNIFTLGELSKDGILYEQSLCIKSEKGLILITGCAHPGIVEIIEKAKQQFAGDIYAVIGGFHLKGSQAQEILNVIDKLKKMNVKYFTPLHCTGKLAVNYFKSNLDCVSLDEI
ncbi:MAG: MBL fold metallo-hydrolase [Elusimicrobiota bacterium]